LLTDNYLGRQIQITSRMLAMLLLKQDLGIYLADDSSALASDAKVLLAQLDALVSAKKIGDAEDTLFDVLDEDASSYAVQAALVFYTRLNEMRDQALADGGFSREEILDGLNEIKAIFGVETV